MEHSAGINHMTKVACDPTAESMKKLLNYEELTNCMRCGFCLPACPTFRETGAEASSPRGRIALMKAAADGYMTGGTQLADQLNQCLGCRACEPACPSGVKYGQLLEQARDAIEEHAEHRFYIRWIRSVFFKYLFPQQNRMRWLGKLLKFYQKSGLQWLIRKTKLLAILPKEMREMEAVLPEASGSGVGLELGRYIPAKGEKIGTVGMFSGCIMDIMFMQTNINTVQLLSEAGFDVVIPENQTCCGALHAHSGERPLARGLAKRNIHAFRKADVDYIISNAGGCGALLKEYDHLVDDKDAVWFASRVKDISEVLVDLSPPVERGSIEETVTYQGSCHLQNGMGVKNQPKQLLKQIAGKHFVELVEADRCCGSAGIYNITQPEMAGSILNEKMDYVKNTQATTLVTSNPGCLLQMKAGIHRTGAGDKMRAVHLVDLLMEAKQSIESPKE